MRNTFGNVENELPYKQRSVYLPLSESESIVKNDDGLWAL